LADSGGTTVVSEEEVQAAFGFTAQVERLPEHIPADDPSYYWDD
jgi:hypothetical protein